MLRYFWKRGNIRKRVCWNRRLRLLFTLCIRVSRKFYLHLCFKLRYYIQNGAKFLQKLTPGFKNRMRNLDNNRQAVQSPKSWNLMGYFCTKNAFLQLEHYLSKIYLTLLSTTCVKIHQITYVIFETYISHFSRHSSSVFSLLKHYILSTKVAYQSANFQIFYCSGWSSPNFSSHFSNKKLIFLFLGYFFSVMRDNSSVLV